MQVKLANEIYNITDKNENFVKAAREEQMTDTQLVKLAFNYGFLEGVEKMAGKEGADLMVKEASEYFDTTGKDYIDELINQADFNLKKKHNG